MPSPQQTEVKKNFKIQENISVVQDWNMTQLLNRETELIFCKIFSTNISQLYLEQRDLVSELKVCRLNQEFKQTGKALSTEKFKNPTFWKKMFCKTDYAGNRLHTLKWSGYCPMSYENHFKTVCLDAIHCGWRQSYPKKFVKTVYYFRLMMASKKYAGKQHTHTLDTLFQVKRKSCQKVCWNGVLQT